MNCYPLTLKFGGYFKEIGKKMLFTTFNLNSDIVLEELQVNFYPIVKNLWGTFKENVLKKGKNSVIITY